ncbi:Phosphofructokinase domain [Dillenia turbinata]|uniref:Phosphofructokinase domain n=1 Tax=Dillenia turbinata TaxID=194707 RepID=A0AAN8VFL2_9MAGN
MVVWSFQLRILIVYFYGYQCRKRKLGVAIVGVPKTIDNDIMLMDKTFRFDPTVKEAQRAINSAYIEAHSAYHGIGVVKLMGGSTGFIAMHASLASGQIDICLIPEVPFQLHGPHGVLKHKHNYCVSLKLNDVDHALQSVDDASVRMNMLHQDMEDEDNLLVEIMDDFDLRGLPSQLEELEECDLFGGRGGMALENDLQESLNLGMSKVSIADGAGNSMS